MRLEQFKQFSLRSIWFGTSFILALLFGLITDAGCGMRFLFYHSLLYFPVVAVYRRWYGIKSKSRCSAVINFLRRRMDKRLGRI